MPAGTHIRVPVIVSANPLRLVGLSVLGALPGAAAGAALGLPVTPLIMLISAAILTLFFAAYRTSARRLLRSIEKAEGDDPAEWIPAGVDRRVTVEMVILGIVLRNWSVLRALSENAIRRGGPGPLLELHPRSSVEQPRAALDVAIEPKLLRPGLRNLDESEAPPDTVGQRLRKSVDMIASFYGDTPRMRMIVAVLMLFGFFSLGIAGYRALQQLLQGGVPDIVWQMGLGLGVGLLISLPRVLSPQQWLLVNGGVVVRSSRWRSSNWTMTRFTPDDATIIYWRNLNLVVVRNTAGVTFSRPITPDEAAVLSQVWRSEIPPPPLEQLSDWE